MVVKLQGYQFKFKLEDDDFVPEPDFKPFMWKKPDDAEDRGNEGAGGAADPGFGSAFAFFTSLEKQIGNLISRSLHGLIMTFHNGHFSALG